MNIKFKKSYYDTSEIKSIEDLLLNGTNYVTKTKDTLVKMYKTNNIFLTSNGSTAFDLLFFALGFEEGGEVLMPSYTFPSSANTVLRMGLKPVFVEIDPHTLVMDIDDVESKITDKTCCIIPTHYSGVSMDMDKLKNIASNIYIIEDAALSIGASYNGKALGTIGDAGIVSFHNTKNVSSDEGGMLLINNEELVDKLDVIYHNGTDRVDFEKGKVNFYSWQMTGMNCGMANINAGMLYSQLEKTKEITIKQKSIYNKYVNGLLELGNKFNFRLPSIPKYNVNNYHIFYLLFENNDVRERVRLYLLENNIKAYTHYFPLHMSNMGKKLGYKDNDLPITKSISDRILRLPIYASLTEQECDIVIDKIREAICKIG